MSYQADDLKYPVWIGEWSLATDVCAHWLGGFNDANTHPQYTCNWKPCPYTYLPASVAEDFDRTQATLGPFGPSEFADSALIHTGMCSDDSLYFNYTDVQKIARCAMDTYDRHVNATFLWTARNEIEAKWDFVKAWDLGWINTTVVPDDQLLDFNCTMGVTQCQKTCLVKDCQT